MKHLSKHISGNKERKPTNTLKKLKSRRWNRHSGFVASSCIWCYMLWSKNELCIWSTITSAYFSLRNASAFKEDKAILARTGCTSVRWAIDNPFQDLPHPKVPVTYSDYKNKNNNKQWSLGKEIQSGEHLVIHCLIKLDIVNLWKEVTLNLISVMQC